ncbi:unnamed protein product [Cuscuta campestris]|uniref:Retrotransposon gag domain-containing protein n=1 Tax=Cuscuta campestris TaxID=132261 RepID=A0A484LUL1_9ASTE|nr:unnamed protein product [Cuscuta campestris]
MLLQSHAYEWWKRTTRNTDHLAQPTWAYFDRVFRAEYIPDSFVEEKQEEFMHLGRDIATFGQDLVNTSKRHCDRFVKGMRPKLQEYMSLTSRQDFGLMYEQAKEVVRTKEGWKVETVQKPAKPAAPRTYAMQGRADPILDVIHGMFSLYSSDMLALIDPGSTFSYISVPRPATSHAVRSRLESPMLVSNPLGHSMSLHYVYCQCTLTAHGQLFPADLIELLYKESDIIFGMDWLTEHQVVVYCGLRTVRLKASDSNTIVLNREFLP